MAGKLVLVDFLKICMLELLLRIYDVFLNLGPMFSHLTEVNRLPHCESVVGVVGGISDRRIWTNSLISIEFMEL